MKSRKQKLNEAPGPRRFKVAVVQAASVAFNLEKTLEKVRRLTREAASQGAKLVLFPEAFVSAYPRGLNLGRLWVPVQTKAEKSFAVTGKVVSRFRGLRWRASAKRPVQIAFF